MEGGLEICYRKRCVPDSEIDDDDVVGFVYPFVLPEATHSTAHEGKSQVTTGLLFSFALACERLSNALQVRSTPSPSSPGSTTT